MRVGLRISVHKEQVHYVELNFDRFSEELRCRGLDDIRSVRYINMWLVRMFRGNSLAYLTSSLYYFIRKFCCLSWN